MHECFKCGARINRIGAYFEVKGYEEIRSTGGANKISLKTRTGRVMCNACATVAKMDRADADRKRWGTQQTLLG